MKTVWKYPLPPGETEDEFGLEIPAPAEIVAFGETAPGVPAIWALVDPEAPPVVVRLRIAGTGHPLPDVIQGGYHRGTAITLGGALVWHLFELERRTSVL